MTSPPSYPSLFSPYTLAGKALRNRIVHAAMNTHMAANTRVTEQLIQYHANRARGGAAMIVTEPISMAVHQNVAYRARAWNDDNLEGLKRWADAVESQDCRLLGQIQDPGRGRHNTGINSDAIGASPLPDDLSWLMPKALTVAEIRQMIAEFAASAQRLQRCGFSGVEISGGHGHLFHQFLSPWSNVRTDEYGGGVEDRARVVTELLAALRETCGKDFILGIRLVGSDFVRGGIDAEEAVAIAVRVAGPGRLDYINFVQGTHGRQLEYHLPDAHGPSAPYRGLFRDIRRAIPGVPFLTVGRITSPLEAEEILASGEAELIGLGRPLLADAAWPIKVAQGRNTEIRECVWCNLCWDTINTKLKPIACVSNPRVALPDETDWRPALAPRKKRVVVVGAGVAGMEAAWIAAARGHEVTVMTRSQASGGKLRWHAQLPGSAPLARIYEYQHDRAQGAGVRFSFGVTATVETVLKDAPDEVVLAAGSRMLPPRWMNGSVVANLREALTPALAAMRRKNGTAVIFDMDHTEAVYASAERLHECFERVVVMTPRDSIAQATAMVTRQGILRRLHQKHIEIVTVSEPCGAVRDGRLDYLNVYNGDAGVIDDVAFFAYATPRIPNDELSGPLSATGIGVHVVGDARNARGLMAAMSEGHAAGNAI